MRDYIFKVPTPSPTNSFTKRVIRIDFQIKFTCEIPTATLSLYSYSQKKNLG